MPKKIFKIYKLYVVSHYIEIFFFLICLPVLLYIVFQTRDQADHRVPLFFLLFALVSLFIVIYLIHELPRLKDVIYLYDYQVVQKRPDGTLISISLKEDFYLIRRAYVQRYDLLSKDRKSKIRIENQLEGLNELITYIWEKEMEKREMAKTSQQPQHGLEQPDQLDQD